MVVPPRPKSRARASLGGVYGGANVCAIIWSQAELPVDKAFHYRVAAFGVHWKTENSFPDIALASC